ncbi:flippase [Psychrobacter sp.]|uniref:flippase n=1 Tax=Psychrobacter sp. TaxID=56811 RepID=UPI003BAECB51
MWQRLLQIKTQLLAHEGFRRYGANTAWLMGEKILRMFIGLFVGIWVARYLGPEQFGLLSYAQSFVFLFTAVATLGLDSIVVRELVRDESQRDVLLGTSFTLKLIGSICILPLLWVAVQFTSNDSYTNLLIFIIASGTIFQSFNVIDFYYQSTVKSKYVAFANTITLGLSSIIKIVLILNNASLTAFAIVGVFDSAILGLGLIYFYTLKSHHLISPWCLDVSLAIRLLLDSWPLAIGSFAAIIYMQIDQVMIGTLKDSRYVGYYAVAVKLSTLWLFITTTIVSTFSPYFTKIFQKNIEMFDCRLQLIYNILMKLSFLICITIYLNSDFIIIYLYGKDYQPAVNILDIYIWSNIFVFMSNASWLFYINHELHKIASYRLVVGAIINVLLNFYLIPLYSLKGAAVATLISYFISSYLVNIFFQDTRKNFIFQTRAIINVFNIKSWLPSNYIRVLYENK